MIADEGSQDTGDAYTARVAMALQAVRDYLNVTQAELAALAGVSDSTISRYEAQKTDKLNAEQLVQIALKADVPIDVLLNPPATRDEVFEAIALHRRARR